MNRFKSGFLLVLTALAVMFGSVFTCAFAESPPATASLIVKMASGLSATEQAAVINRDGGTEVSSMPALRLHVVTVPVTSLPLVLQNYQSDSQVERVEQNQIRKAEGIPSDLNYGVQWALPKIGYNGVFGALTANGAARVALLDTGIDASHPDLLGKIIPGTSILNGSQGLSDPNGHGTALAGIIAALTDNGSGIAGIAYQGVSIMPVTVLDANANGEDGNIIAGIVWAADNGADVIVMGFSNPAFSQNLQDAIDYAWSKGAVLVAATGNDSLGAPTFPAGDRGVIGVSATDMNDALASFSNYGQDVFLAAPGTDIYTTGLNGSYAYVSGTSTSSAIVGGVAAFMKAVDPSLTNGVIAGRLAKSADAVGTPGDANNTSMFGNGRINMVSAVADTSTDSIQPAGAAPVGTGGPYVGPYTAAEDSNTKPVSISLGSQAGILPYGTGSSATYPITIVTDGHGSQNNHFTISGLPAGATAAFSPAMIDLKYDQTATLTIATTAATPSGDFTFTVSSTEFPNVTGSGTLTVSKAAANVILSNLSQTYTGSPLKPTVTTIPANLQTELDNPPQTKVGSHPVTAKIIDPNYQGSATGTLVITKANQTITVTTPAPASAAMNTTFSVAAVAASGLAVTYSSGTPNVCTNVGPQFTIVSGTGSCAVQYDQAGDDNYNPASQVTSATVAQKAMATVALSGLSATYDSTAKPVSATTTPAGLNVAITYNGSATPPANAGSYAVSATVNDANYQGSANGILTIAKASHAITWDNPGDLLYGTALGATQLNAATSLPGSFEYTPAAGTMLSAGNGQTLSVTFTPADETNYSAATKTVTINVLKATPGITWTTPTDTTYGTPLGISQLNAAATVPGSFAYTPAAGAVLSAGNGQTLSVTFTPADTGNYNSATKSVAINVLKAMPAVSWNNPADIGHGTPLGTAQLNAAATVPGSFAYTPAAGTMLNAGSGQILSVTFTPADSTNYNTATGSATINVVKGTPTVTWTNPADIGYGAALGAAQLSATASVPGSFAYTPAAGTVLSAGNGQTLSVAFTPADSANYNTATGSVAINVLKAIPTINWATPADIGYGTALGATQLNASASVPGTFAYTPAAGTVPNAGNGQTLTVTFTPTDTANYGSATKTVTVNILKAIPVITWANLADLSFGTALGATQFNAAASVPGSFAYTPAAGTVLNAGNGQPLSATFTPTDSVNYGTATKSVTITVIKATPTVSAWPTASAIGLGQAIGTATFTGGSASVAGSFAFTTPTIVPDAGVYSAGVMFTPTDAANYTTVSGSVNVSVLGPCGPTGNISVPSANSTGNISVSWGASSTSGATYVLEYSLNGGAWTLAYSGLATTATVAVSADGSYVFRVRATKAGYADSTVKTSGACAVTLVCGASASITVPATNNTGNVSVNWGSSNVSGVTYILEYSADGTAWTQAYSGTTNSTTVSGLANGTYTFRVKATKAGYADSSLKISGNCEVALVCGASASITVPATSNTGNVNVSWSSSNVSGVTYILDYSTDGSAWTQAYSGTTNGTAVSGLTGGTYIFRVRATKTGYADSAAKLSGNCVVTLVCGTPASITVPSTNSTGSISISWGSSNVSGVIYVLEYSSNGTTWTTAYSGAATTAVVNGITNGTYTFQVKATRDGYGDSPAKVSGNCVVTLACGTPASITVPAINSTGSIPITWASSNISGATYILEYSLDGGTWNHAYNGPATNATVNGLVNGTYTFRVKAIKDGYADSAAKVSGSCAVSLACGAPASISVPSANNTGTITITWASSNISGAGYTLEYSINGGNWNQAYSGTSTNATISDLGNGTYAFRVKATKAGFPDSTYTTSGACAVTLACGSPSTITVPAASSTGSINVSWSSSDVNGATYLLEYSTDSTTWSQAYSGAATNATINGLANGTYTFRVKASKAGYTDSAVKVSGSCTVTLVCGAPSSITAPATNSTGSINVNWGSSTIGGVTYIMEYNVNGGAWTQAYSGSAISTVFNAPADGTYLFRVKAAKAGFPDSAYTTSGSCTVVLVCGAPASIAAPAANTTGSLLLNWGNSDISGVTYIVEYSADGGAWTPAFSGLSTSATVTVPASGSYVFRVKATKAGFPDSSYTISGSCAVTLVCGAPASINVPATNNTNSVYLSWGSSNISGVTYIVEYSADGGAWTQTYSGPSTTATIAVPISATYVFRVKAIKAGFPDSVYTTSDSCVVTLVCSAPASITAPAANSTGSIYLSWGNSNVGGVTYIVEYSADNGPWTQAYSGTSASATVTVPASGSYTFRVRATKAAFADSGNTISGSCAVALVCGAPDSINAPSGNSTGSIYLSWGNSNIGGVTYIVEYSVDGGAWTPVYSGTSTSANVSVPTSGSYAFRVKATKAGYPDSGYTTSSSCAVSLVCGTPASLSAPAANSTGNIYLSWGNSNIGGVTYVVEYSADGGAWTQAYSGPSTSTTINVPVSGSYTFRVRATKAAFADSASTLSGSCTVTLVCGMPDSISTPTVNGSGRIYVSWANSTVSGVTYILEYSVDGGDWTPAYSGLSTSATITGLAKGTYTFRVKATRTNYEDSAYKVSSSLTI